MFFKVAIIILGSILPIISELYPVFEAKSIDPFNNLIFIFFIFSGDLPSGSIDSDTESMVSSVSGYEFGGKKKIR